MSAMRDAAREAYASGGTIQEIAEAMGESSERVAEWVAAEAKRRDIDIWELGQRLAREAEDQLNAARAAGDSNTAKQLVASIGRLMPVLAAMQKSRVEDGVRVLPSEIAGAEARVRELVDAALRGRGAPK